MTDDTKTKTPAEEVRDVIEEIVGTQEDNWAYIIETDSAMSKAWFTLWLPGAGELYRVTVQRAWLSA